MISILFTTSNKFMGRLIRTVTGEPVSHCAIKYHSIVIHSSFSGVNVERYDSFCLHSQVVFEVPVEDRPEILEALLADTDTAMYNLPGLIWSGLSLLAHKVFPWIVPKRNLWKITGMYMCTEFVTKFLYGEEDSMITPYKLYLRLIGQEGQV